MPKTIDTGAMVSLRELVIVNLGLVAIFGIQHSLMARPGFKDWWTQWVPRPIERSTYVLLASLALALLCWQWRPMPAVLWRVADPTVANAIIGLSLLGWLVVLTSSYLINHFELFGLQQVFDNLRDREMPEPVFRTPFFYKFVRHPIYLGFIIALWAAPTMSAGHLLLAASMTVYIVIGVPARGARPRGPVRRRLSPLPRACLGALPLAPVRLTRAPCAVLETVSLAIGEG